MGKQAEAGKSHFDCILLNNMNKVTLLLHPRLNAPYLLMYDYSVLILTMVIFITVLCKYCTFQLYRNQFNEFIVCVNVYPCAEVQRMMNYTLLFTMYVCMNDA